MHKLNIKPLSVNQSWQGRRYKTKKYDKYIKDICMMLGDVKIPKGYLQLTVTWGFSNNGSDIDNCLKPFIDCLQKKYGFNDNLIKRLIVDVEQVKKDSEFIEWEITSINLNKD